MAEKNWKRFFACGCSHGVYIHEEDSKACLEHKKEWNPHLTFHLGDWMDTACIRSGVRPVEDSFSADLTEDWACAKKFLEELRPNVTMVGNHEDRLWKNLESSSGERASLAKMCVAQVEAFFEKLGSKLLPYHERLGVYKLGQLALFHGFKHNQHAEVNHATMYGMDCITTHVHRMAEKTNEGGFIGRTAGYLADGEAMSYVRPPTRRLVWERGWAYGYYNDRTGDYQVWMAKKTRGGEWIL